MLSRINKPVIYFAGKIARDDWRTQIFGDRVGSPHDFDDTYGFACVLDETYTKDMHEFLYGGPFFISCDHGCAHGPASHGASPTGCLNGAADGVLETREKIWDVNRARIRRADFVFAYINETDCFGTLIELGYAAALHKQTGIGVGRNIKIEEFDDLWMARQCHNLNGEKAWLGTPQETFGEFLAEVLARVRVIGLPIAGDAA